MVPNVQFRWKVLKQLVGGREMYLGKLCEKVELFLANNPKVFHPMQIAKRFNISVQRANGLLHKLVRLGLAARVRFEGSWWYLHIHWVHKWCD